MTKPINTLVEAWIEKGGHDLGSAKIIFQYIPEYFDTIAFHCQQAVEKYMKAALIFKGIKFQRTHDLSFLLELLSRAIRIDPDQFDKAIALTNFAIESRYPDQQIYLSKDELIEAISIAEEFRKFTTEIIQ